MGTAALTRDQMPLPAGTNEELAGPPHTAAPVQQQERINTIDSLRGFALLGILLMNILDFAYPLFDILYPGTMVKPVFTGPHWHLNTALWFSRWIFAEGKMRGIFSMLFGAGVLLLTDRAEARGAGIRAADIFLRRNLWLTLFGAAHCFLIWEGDILFSYGLFALLFLFPLRGLRARTLLYIAIVLFLLNNTVLSEIKGHSLQTWRLHKAAEQAYAARAAHQPLSTSQVDAITSWESKQRKPRTNQALYKDIAEHQEGYLPTRLAKAEASYQAHTMYELPAAGDWGTMMVLGMAFYRFGFLTGRWSRKAYAWTAVVALSISLPLTTLFTWYMWKTRFSLLSRAAMGALTDTGRVAGAIGIAALLLLVMKAGLFQRGFRLLANVGQTALSNYILTSLVMQTLFVWSPLHWYGYLELYQVYLVVLGMWVINLVVSYVWLKHFQFGPLEWLWRSLTYWKKQSMVLRGLGYKGQ